MKQTIKFELEKETKGTVRYSEVGKDQVVGTIYVRKFALPEPFPKNLTVTITAE